MKYIQDIGYAYLGIALVAFTNLTLFDWEFYAIIIPTVFLNVITKRDI